MELVSSQQTTAYDMVGKVSDIESLEERDVPVASKYSRMFILKVSAVFLICAAVVVLGAGFGTGYFESLLKKPFSVKAHIGAMKNSNTGGAHRKLEEMVSPASLSPSLTSSAYAVVDKLELMVGGIIFRSASQNGQLDFPMQAFPVSFGLSGDDATISFPTPISVPGSDNPSYTVS